jgi:hypothetical protein
LAATQSETRRPWIPWREFILIENSIHRIPSLAQAISNNTNETSKATYEKASYKRRLAEDQHRVLGVPIEEKAGRIIQLGTVAFFLYNFLKGNRTRREGKLLKSCPRYGERKLTEILGKILSRSVSRDEIRSAKKQLVHFQLIEIKKSKSPRWGYQDRIIKLRGGNHKLKWPDVFCPRLMILKEQKKRSEQERKASRRRLRNLSDRFHIDTLKPCSIRDMALYGVDSQRAIDAFQMACVRRIEFFFRERNGKTVKTRIRKMSQLLNIAINEQKDLIARPYDAPLIMLDEVIIDELNLLRPYSFFAQETSPNNYQVWLCATLEDEQKEIRERLIKKFNPDGAKDRMNGGSYGALRWPDSINWKPQHNQFRVRVTFVNDNQTVTIAELEDAGLLAAAEVNSTHQGVHTNTRQPLQGDYWLVFPDWEFFRTKKNGQRSLADAAFIWECLQRGFTPDEIKVELRKVSPKVQEEQSRRGSDYYLDHQIQYVLGKVNSGKIAAVA